MRVTKKKGLINRVGLKSNRSFRDFPYYRKITKSKYCPTEKLKSFSREQRERERKRGHAYRERERERKKERASLQIDR